MWKITIVISLILLPVIIFFIIKPVLVFSQESKSRRIDIVKKSKNFNGEKFVNSLPTVIMQPNSFWDNLQQIFTGGEIRKPPFELEPFIPDLNILKTPPKSGLRVTWMGHSTVLIEIDGKRFLTDPVWSSYTSPIPFIGPKRFFDMPFKLSQLPQLDGIIISHDHYDHLDHSTIKELGKTDVIFYAPLNVGAYLEDWGIPKQRIKEFDWWDSIKIDEKHTLVATPARHFSGRMGFINSNNTLWSSWVIIGDKHRVYFGGDSGMFPGFKEIGDKYGPFDLTMLEVGAYSKNWKHIHLGPESAIEAHIALKGKVLLPIHWGTFQLAFHSWDDPAKQLISFAKNKNISLLIPEPGASSSLPNSSYICKWWLKPEIKSTPKEAACFLK